MLNVVHISEVQMLIVAQIAEVQMLILEHGPTAFERNRNNLKRFKDFRPTAKALTDLYVPYSLGVFLRR